MTAVDRRGVDVEALTAKLSALRPSLDEQQWRLLLGAEAEAIGWGGIGVVARASGASRTTVSTGVKQVRAGVVHDGRVRGPGAGRPSVKRAQPGIEQALESLVAPETRGDPMSLLRWTTKSLGNLSKGLGVLGYTASTTTVSGLLRGLGYRLQSTFKTKEEGGQHPDRDAQFTYINDLAAAFLVTGDAAVSVDTKKKELVGEYVNNGREWQPAGQPVRVNGHDFPTGVPKAIPYGVYDLAANSGFVSVGMDHDTAAFAAHAVRTWWQHVGAKRYPNSTRLLITADAGGSNGYRLRAWKVELAKLAVEIGRDITVVHYPSGTSKWNKIEHRLFSFISINWRGRPLTEYQVIIDTISATTTATGLTVEAMLDDNTYPTGVKISKAQMKAVPLTPHQFHGEWNYTIHTGQTSEPGPRKQVRGNSTK
jgi:Rhodopirellula transposase DDE domain